MISRAQDQMAAEEIDRAMQSPEAMQAAVDGHKIDLVFHLWESDGDGVASRKRVTRALTWYYRHAPQFTRFNLLLTLFLLSRRHRVPSSFRTQCLATLAGGEVERGAVLQPCLARVLRVCVLASSVPQCSQYPQSFVLFNMLTVCLAARTRSNFKEAS